MFCTMSTQILSRSQHNNDFWTHEEDHPEQHFVYSLNKVYSPNIFCFVIQIIYLNINQIRRAKTKIILHVQLKSGGEHKIHTYSYTILNFILTLENYLDEHEYWED